MMRSKLLLPFFALLTFASGPIDHQEELPWICHTIDDSFRGADGVKLGDINRDGLPDITTGWEEEGITRVYLHPGFKRVTEPWQATTVGRTPSVEDAVFADVDNDGVLDVISCCEGKEKRVYIHWAPPSVTGLSDPNQWKQSVLPASDKLMAWMYAWPLQIDEKAGVDIVAGGKGRGAELGWFEVPSNSRDVETYKWHTITPVGWIMSIWMRDMDGDQDSDIVISDRYGAMRGCRWLENPGPGSKQQQHWPNHNMGAQEQEVLSMAMADMDGDGLEDAVVAIKNYQLLILRRLNSAGTSWLEFPVSADYSAGNTRAVAVHDVNHDGRQDLVFTTWNSRMKHGVMWLECLAGPYDGKWKVHVLSGTEKGVKYDRIEMVDLDGDGDRDLLTCEEREGGKGMGVFWYENPFSTPGAR